MGIIVSPDNFIYKNRQQQNLANSSVLDSVQGWLPFWNLPWGSSHCSCISLYLCLVLILFCLEWNLPSTYHRVISKRGRTQGWHFIPSSFHSSGFLFLPPLRCPGPSFGSSNTQCSLVFEHAVPLPVILFPPLLPDWLVPLWYKGLAYSNFPSPHGFGKTSPL